MSVARVIAVLVQETEGPLVEEDDLFTWLSEQWWTPWVMFIVSISVGLWMIRSLVVHRGRARQIERAAAASAMAYQAQDGRGLSKIGFSHFATGDGRGWTATDVVTHRGRDDVESHAFDVRSWTEFDVIERENGERAYRRRRPGGSTRGLSNVVRRHQGSTRSAAMTPIPLNAPRLVIARENVASKLFTRATRLDLDVESEAFNRSYHVICADRRFAVAMLDARMVDLMVRSEGRISFEFFGTWALLHTVRLEPELLAGLARFAEELRGVVPRLAIEGWPSAGQTGLRATIR